MKDEMEKALSNNNPSVLGDELPYKMQVAAAALLVYAAKADGTFTEDELDQVMRALAKEFKNSDHDTAIMIEVAAFLHAEEKRINDFCDMLKHSLASDQKAHLLALVGKVIRADGRVSVAERILAGRLAKRLCE